jgi:tetratricopeptide (TPR) repeat protein
LDLNPDLDYVQSNLSYSFLLSGNTQKAILHGEKAVGLAPGSLIARNHLGLAYGLAGETEKCYEQFRELGGEAVARNNLGLVFLEHNRIDEAIREFQAAAKLRPFYRVAAQNYQRATKMKIVSLKSAAAQKKFLAESSYTEMTPVPISLVGINFLNGLFTELLTHAIFDSMFERIGLGSTVHSHSFMKI